MESTRWKKEMDKFFEHPAMEYCNDMITLNAVRTSGKGWQGETLDVPLKALIEKVEKETAERVVERLLSATKMERDIPKNCKRENCSSCDEMRGFNRCLKEIKELLEAAKTEYKKDYQN